VVGSNEGPFVQSVNNNGEVRVYFTFYFNNTIKYDVKLVLIKLIHLYLVLLLLALELLMGME
jgi:hypothetical protein